MSFSSGARTDMVVSMTLAELFLMLVFVMWYGYAPESKDAELARLLEQVAKLEAEIIPARKMLAENEIAIREQARALDWWRRNNPRLAHLEGSDIAPDGKGGTDLPPCHPVQNVLVEADVRQSRVSMRVLVHNPAVAESLDAGVAYPPVGMWLTDVAVIQSFVDAIRKHNVRQPCRWHYRLYHETKSDYADGRLLLETVLYPGRILATPPPA